MNSLGLQHWRRLAVMLLTWVSANACDASDRSGADKAMVLTEQSTGTVAQARAGKPVEIRLRAQPGTGFSWFPKNHSVNLTPMESIRGPAIAGGWQIQRFRFLTRHAGTYRLAFSYDQPWTGGIKATHSATFTIEVR